MAGAVCVVGGSSSKAGGACSLGGGDLMALVGRKHVAAPRLELTTSFLDHSSIRAFCWAPPKNLERERRRKKKMMTVVAVGGLGGQYEDSFDDVKMQILNYFTYKAVRTVLNQLYEMNPPQYRWFYNYVASNELGYGKTFIRKLVKDKRELAERVMVTRLHLYGRWIKKCDHVEMYEKISDQNLQLMRERLIETVIWPSDDTNTEVVG